MLAGSLRNGCFVRRSEFGSGVFSTYSSFPFTPANPGSIPGAGDKNKRLTSNLHPFFTHGLDAGPVRFVTISHAFNYRMAVLRDGGAAWPMCKALEPHASEPGSIPGAGDKNKRLISLPLVCSS